MSHGDEAVKLPQGFSRIATSDACANAAFSDETRKIYALQFHPEVTHSEHGTDMLRRFVEVCRPAPWSMDNFEQMITEEIMKDVGDRNVFMLVSGGVDSSVAFTLLNKVLGTARVQGLLVDTGLMRKDEVGLIDAAFKKLGITNLHVVDASEEFFTNLRDVYEPEQKRTIIGDTFLSVQKRISEEMGLSIEKGWMLGQGTIYPDTIETGGTKHADKIKTHHNRVDAIQVMIDQGLVVEPLKELYKDEVRKLGEDLGLPHAFVWRHPFPGPGLGVRILCTEKRNDIALSDPTFIKVPYSILPIQSVGVLGDGRTYRHAVSLFSSDAFVVTDEHLELATTIPNKSRELNRVLLCLSHRKPFDFSFTPGYLTAERADLLREADVIVHNAMMQAGLYEKIWQFPVVLLPCGEKPDMQSIVLRPIASTDAMTANAFMLPSKVLQSMTERILALQGIDCVFLDLTNKPPATIEWE
jgi:GMP synthase (glutamine-hydrolysing)